MDPTNLIIKTGFVLHKMRDLKHDDINLACEVQ